MRLNGVVTKDGTRFMFKPLLYSDLTLEKIKELYASSQKLLKPR